MNQNGNEKIVKTNENKRDTTYDWLRLIATIFVVIGHSAYLSMQTKYGGGKIRSTTRYKRTLPLFNFEFY